MRFPRAPLSFLARQRAWRDRRVPGAAVVAAVLALDVAVLACVGLAPTIEQAVDPARVRALPPLGATVELGLAPAFPFRVAADSPAEPLRSNLVVLEDGVALGPAHAPHATVSDHGRGAYSYWQGSLYFSASDGRDVRGNGRTYAVRARAEVRPGVLLAAAALSAALLITVAVRLLSRLEWLAEGGDRRGSEPDAGRYLARHLGAPVRLVARAVALPALLVLAVLGLAYAGASLLDAPARKRIALNDTASIAVFEQAMRARELGAADLLLVGDSSCLMGIDMRALGAALPGTAAASLCSIAYLGPEGYAALLEARREARAPPRALIVALHPDGFRRDPSWDAWLAFVGDDLLAVEPPSRHPYRAALSALEHLFVDRFVYVPFQGAFGLYYGSKARLQADIRDWGHALDPGDGLHATSLAEALARPGRRVCAEPYDLSTNARFLAALARLRQSLRAAPDIAVHVLQTPLPESCVGPGSESESAASRRAITDALGIPAGRVIDLPIALPDGMFSTPTHLNLWGRQHYTALLGARLREILGQ